ncbi:MAG: hypothetical protein ACREA0_34130, partial [bacterium]
LVATACAVSGLLAGVMYEWKVVATDQTGQSVQGPIWRFTTNQPPNLPAALAPADEATGQNFESLNLRWSATDSDGDTLLFRVLFGMTEDPTGMACDWDAATDCARQDLLPGRVYHWKVKVSDGISERVGGPWKFTTRDSDGGPIPPPPDPGLKP